MAAAAEPASSADMYEVLSAIGKGSFGTVSKIRRKHDGRVMVWKELNYGTMREKEKQLVVSEVNILRELRHPFIVRYYDRIIDKASTKLYIVMEYAEGGDLGAMIKKAKREGGSVDEEFVWKVFAQVTVALKECHRHKESPAAAAASAAAAAATGAGGGAAPVAKLKPILHRDLKPGNIFLDAAQNVKVGDFGLAKELASESKFAYTNVGTPFYMSPEMINEMRYNEKSDIWALGCLLFELCALVPPFEAANQLALAVKINAGKFARIPPRYSDDLHRAIRWMLQTEYTKRPSVEDLEGLPRIKAGIERCAPLLAAYPGRAPAPVDALAKREAAVAVAEAALAAREAAVKAREQAVARREGARAAEDARRRAAGSRPSSAGGAAAAAPLSRAYSTGDVAAAMAAFRATQAQVAAVGGGGARALPTVTVALPPGADAMMECDPSSTARATKLAALPAGFSAGGGAPTAQAPAEYARPGL